MTDAVPRAGLDGWYARGGIVSGRRTRWLERSLGADHVEQYFGDGAPIEVRTCQQPVRLSPSAPERQRVTTTSSPVTLTPRRCGLAVIVSPTALRTIHDEIRKRERAIADDLIETGGGIFGPPLQSWHGSAEVRLATVAAASRRRNSMDIAYGELEATEAHLAHREGSHLRRIGDWHVHPQCPAGRVGEPSPADMSAWLRELDRIDQSRLATRYVGIIATEGVRGWFSPPKLHAWVVRRDSKGRPVCESAVLTERRHARTA